MKSIVDFIKDMTLEEKASLCSGFDFWRTKEIKRLNIPSVMVCDGPNGLRKQATRGDHMGLSVSVEAVCFPTGSASAATFDRNILKELGNKLGEAARNENLHTVLGPAMNIKRSPLCGRNFEYLSEDPYLAGELATSYVEGIQNHNVGVSIKHFAANNQEQNRMSTDVIISERALREIYLSAFEKVVKKAKPWAVMCAYNRINGTYCCENNWLLTDVLRKEWGFKGIVMTDWGAMNDRINALKAGLELEMPSSNGIRDRQIVKAVKEGKLDESVLDESVERLLTWIFNGLKEDSNKEIYSKDAQHEFAKKLAENAAVLLKNDNSVLPLKKEDKVIFIGTFAEKIRYQGGGSSHVNSYKVSNLLSLVDVPYYPGWGDDGVTCDIMRLKEALNATSQVNKVIVFAGLPDSYESEGFDRTHINLPSCQNELIKELEKTQKDIVVVLFNGSPIAMPWVSSVKGILEMNLGGEAVAEAIFNILYGKVNPSGHLAETYPLRLEDNPSYLSFPGNGKKVFYREDIFVGYRWYDSRKMPVLFPFGHGLSYTTFILSNPKLEKDTGNNIKVVVTLENTGTMAGATVVQVYVAPPLDGPDRPSHELKGFEKIYLEPKEKRQISFILDHRAFAYYSEDERKWAIPYGEYKLEIGFSSRDIREVLRVITGTKKAFNYDSTTTIEDFKKAGLDEKLPQEAKTLFKSFGVEEGTQSGVLDKKGATRMFLELPIHSMMSFVLVEDDFLDKVKESLEKQQ